jgi:hypothetical protein
MIIMLDTVSWYFKLGLLAALVISGRPTDHYDKGVRLNLVAVVKVSGTTHLCFHLPCPAISVIVLTLIPNSLPEETSIVLKRSRENIWELTDSRVL